VPAGKMLGRKWPPVVAAVVAAVLVFIVLPNPFRIPQNNPSAQAEYAPTTGPQADAPNANFGETALPQSAGIGAGGQGEGALPGSPPPILQQFKPRQKNCVGNPPRQTEDPLSPPCVPFFEGNNGGETFRGVTKDEIRIVFYNDRCCNGDMTEPYSTQDEGACTYDFECEYIVRTVKAMLRYFQARYQTYGREVKLIAQKSSGDVGAACASRASDAQQTVAEHDPFAVVHLVGGSSECYMQEALKLGIASFGIQWPMTPEEYEKAAPYAWGFEPDLVTRTRWSASFICRKLRGETAKFSKDPVLSRSVRTFGFIRPEGDSRGPELREQAEILEAELLRQCNMEFDSIKRFQARRIGAGSSEAPDIMASFKRDGITTVVCYCIAVATEETVPAMMKAATGAGYFPEWYFDSSERMDQPVWIQQQGANDHTMFGATLAWREPEFRSQFWYQAYLSQEPDTKPNTRFGYDVYHLLLNLFQGTQGAGPDLGPETVERGMFTFNYLDRKNPFVPIGGYGAYNADAVSDYTFLDTAMAWWWDPTGTPPGGRQAEGCMRVPRQGLRFYAGEWPRGDSDLFAESDPCSEDVREIADARASDF